jgi:hypothetical protein
MENTMAGYDGQLQSGDAIHIPSWPVDVALINLSQAGKAFGLDNLIEVSKLNPLATLVCVANSKEPDQTASLMSHFVTQCRIEGEKITPSQINSKFEGNLALFAEVFAHVIKAQYSDFFDYGLAKDSSPKS